MTHGNEKREAVSKNPYSQVLRGSQAAHADALLAGTDLEDIATLCQSTDHSQEISPGSQQHPVHSMN